MNKICSVRPSEVFFLVMTISRSDVRIFFSSEMEKGFFKFNTKTHFQEGVVSEIFFWWIQKICFRKKNFGCIQNICFDPLLGMISLPPPPGSIQKPNSKIWTRIQTLFIVLWFYFFIYFHMQTKNYLMHLATSFWLD